MLIALVLGMDIYTIAVTGCACAVMLLLVYAAYTDIKHRKISNELNIFIFMISLLYCAIIYSHTGDFMTSVAHPALVALGVFFIGLIMFSLGIMGGGDVKLLSGLALMLGPSWGMHLIVYSSLIGGLLAIFSLIKYRYKLQKSLQLQKDKPTIAYGIAISASGIWLIATNILPLPPIL